MCKTIDVIYLSQEEIEETAKSRCLEKCFKSAPVLKGIAKLHSLQPFENGLVRCCTYSFQNTWEDKGRELLLADSEESLSDLSEDCLSEDEEKTGDEDSNFSEMCDSMSSDGETSTAKDEQNSYISKYSHATKDRHVQRIRKT